MTIIIPYKSEVHAGMELLYALRSIEKNLSGWSDIIVIGKPPAWYTGKSIPAEDQPGRKQFNIYSKILLACNKAEVSENFICWNDDHYLLKPLGVEGIKYWYNRDLAHQLNKVGGREKKALQETIKMLSGVSLHYDIHTPIVYNKTCFKWLFNNRTTEFLIKSYYTNVVPKDLEFIEFMEDPKEKKGLFFSTGTTLSLETISYLQTQFPIKSKFEK